jgi:hypothetical protein
MHINVLKHLCDLRDSDFWFLSPRTFPLQFVQVYFDSKLCHSRLPFSSMGCSS